MSNTVRAGRAQVELTLLDRTQQGLNRASARLKGFSMSIAAVGGTLLAGAAAMAAPLIPAIKAASDYEEIMSKFDTVFGSQAGDVKTWSDAFAGEVGRSKSQISEFMASSQDLFVPIGFEEGVATDLSKQLTGLAIDIASFNNRGDEEVLLDLHRALTGSGEVMKKFGVLLNEAGTKAELLKQGLDPATATEQQKAMARLNIIIAGTKAAQGDAIRTSAGFANQMKRLDGVVTDLKVSVGAALLPTLSSLAAMVSPLITLAGEWIGNNEGLVRTFAMVVVGIAAAAGVILAIGGAGMALSMVLTGLSAAIGVVGSVIGVLLSPFVLLPALLLLAGAAFLHFTGQLGSTMQMAQDVGGGMLTFLRETVGAMGQALMGGDLALAGKIMWTSLQAAWQAGTMPLRQGWIEFWAGISQVMDGVVTGLRQVWIGFTTGLASYLLKVWENVQNLLGALAKIEGMVFGDGVISSLADALTIDVDGTIATLKEDQSRKSDAVDAARAARETERANQLTADLAETENQLAALQAERAKLLAAGNATETLPAVAALLGKIDATKQGLATAPPAVTPDPAAGVAAAGKIAGTFSSAAAGRMGLAVNDPGKQTAKHTRAMAKTLVAMEKRMGRGEGLTWGA